MSVSNEKMDKWETFSKSSSSSSETGASRITIGLHTAYFDGSCCKAACVSGLSSTDSCSKDVSSDSDSCDEEVSACIMSICIMSIKYEM